MRSPFAALVSLVALLSAASSLSAQAYDPWVVGKVDAARADVIYSDAIPTPHRDWAKPYYGGKVKALLVPNLITGREAVELAQRLDLDYDTVSLVQQYDVFIWGLGDLLKERKAYSQAYRAIESHLNEKKYDVMVMAGFTWNSFPQTMQDRVLKSVKEGMGLVIIGMVDNGKNPVTDDVREMLIFNSVFDDRQPAAGGWVAKPGHYVSDGLAIDAVSAKLANDVYAFKEITGGTVLIATKTGDRPVLAVKELGAGRVCAFTWKGTWAVSSFTPAASGDYYEYLYSMLLKSVLWAAKKDAPVALTDLRISAPAFAPEQAPEVKLDLGFQTGAALRAATVELSVWDEANALLGTQSQNVAVDAKGNRLAFTLPKTVATGTNFAVFTLKDGGKVVAWWTLPFEVTKEATVAKIELAKADGNDVIGTVSIGGKADKPLKLDIELLDNFGRVIDRATKDARPGDTPAFRFRKDGVVSIIARVRATLRKGEQLIDRATSEAIIVAPPVDENDFPVGTYGRLSTGYRDYLNRDYFRRLNDLGVDSTLASNDKAILFGYEHDMDFRASASIGHPWLGFYAQAKQPFVDAMKSYAETKDKKYLIRTSGCLSDPATLAKMKEICVKALKNKLPYGRHIWDVGGECSLTSYRDPADFCFSEFCITRFRGWLKGEYKTLDALNASWGTTFATWDDVMPMTTEEVLEHFKKSNSFAAWADHRTFMEVVWADTFRQIDSWVKELDPKGSISVNGAQSTSVHNGNDWSRLDPIMGGCEPYNVGAQYELHRSFNPKMRLTMWTGYGAKGVGASYGIWYAVFHGFRGANIFWDYEILNPDYTASESGRDIGRTLHEIKSQGIGYLLNSAARVDDPIAILYSVPSIHGDYIHRKAAGNYFQYDHLASLSGICLLVGECGYQYKVISYEQLGAGALAKSGYRALVLPMSVALSKAEVDAITGFVKDGGTLISMPLPGIMDEHCRLYETPPMLELLGVKFKKGKSQFTAEANAPKLAVGSSSIVSAPVREPWSWSVEPTTAKVLATTDYFGGAYPLVLCNAVGKGRAYYVSCRAVESNRILEFNERRGNTELKKYLIGLFDAAFRGAGVAKDMTVTAEDGSPADQYTSYFFRSGRIRYDILLPHYRGETTTGADGVTYTKDAEGNASQKYVVAFAKRSHVYEVRTGTYLGQVDKLTEPATFGSPKIYACLPYKVTGVSVASSAKSAKQGQAVTVSAKLQIAGADACEDHAARLNVYKPSGELVPFLSKCAKLEAGAKDFSVRFAFNDEPGAWTFEVVDVVSGQKGRTKVTVE